MGCRTRQGALHDLFSDWFLTTRLGYFMYCARGTQLGDEFCAHCANLGKALNLFQAITERKGYLWEGWEGKMRSPMFNCGTGERHCYEPRLGKM